MGIHPCQAHQRVDDATYAELERRRKDYEEMPETGEAWVQIVLVHLMLKWLEPS